MLGRRGIEKGDCTPEGNKWRVGCPLRVQVSGTRLTSNKGGFSVDKSREYRD